MLDVGNGIKGVEPREAGVRQPAALQLLRAARDRWPAGAHAVFRHRNYVFVGDEVFPAYSIASRDRILVKGIVHVVDVSDIQRPHVVATYEVPEGGSYNMWVEDDVMYLGYYNAGARVVDVSVSCTASCIGTGKSPGCGLAIPRGGGRTCCSAGEHSPIKD